MKRIATILSFLVAVFVMAPSVSNAQCLGCIIDTQCGANLNPAEPALCPEMLPNGTQGQPYDENATFFMPRDFTDSGSGQDVVLNSITVTSVTGMPQGLSYDCDQPNCSYTITNDPITQRGCVKMCGVPAIPGNYNIIIQVVANVTAPVVGTINTPVSFTLPLTVDPAPGGNCCFTYNPPSACDEVDVTFGGLLNFGPVQPTTHDWDFDNGNTSTEQDPPVQNYSTPGEYYPELTTTVYNYVLDAVDVTASGTGWCGDVEETNWPVLGCTASPDLYFAYTNDIESYTSTEGSDNLSESWSGLTIEMNTLLFSMTFWDSDGTSPDDNLGAMAFSVSDTGTFSFSNSEVFGTYHIGLSVDDTFITEDTVNVFPIPAQPSLTFSPSQEICLGDSVLIDGPSGPYQYQWLNSGSFISDSSAVWVNSTAYYSLVVIDTTFYCGTESDSSLVEVFSYPLPPVIGYNASTNNLEITNNPNGYPVVWYVDGVLNQGETGDTLPSPGTAGPFSALFANGGLCESAPSTEYWLCLPAEVTPLANDTICCGETVTFDATGFTVNPFSAIAWAMTPEADGPVVDQASATQAEADGNILPDFGETIDYARTCNSYLDSVASGNYYVTPFAIDNPTVTPLTYDTLEGCAPYAEICPSLSAADDGWEINPMIFTFPDGSQLNVNDALASGLPITQQLLDLVGGLPCLALTDLFAGDPNGVWSISVTNTGTTDLDMSVPDFIVINSADSCNLISEDESYFIDGIDVTAEAGGSVTVDFDIPPLPTNFPSINSECTAYGDPILVTIADCFPWLTNNLEITGIINNPTLDLLSNYIYGNIDVTITGGIQPYTISWTDGPTSEDRLNLIPGSYTINVEDANGLMATETFVLTGPYLGVEELDQFGFSLGQSIPNPTSGNSNISFVSKEQGAYTFIVRDATGRVVSTLPINAKVGDNNIIFDGSRLTSGVYTYSLSNDVNALTNRMIISK